jgi:lysozyme family protein
MRNISKFFVSFIVGTVLCFPSANAEVNQEYVNKVDSLLDADYDSRHFFSYVIVEDALEEWKSGNPDVNIDVAVQEINRLYRGRFSVNDLFFICLIAYEKKSISVETIDEMWPICVKEFISPLVEKAKQTNVLDDIVLERYDGSRSNQECTPSVHVDGISDIICASGNYAFDPAFEKAMITKFRSEGGCKDVGDGNGVTCFGVGAKHWPVVNNCNFSRWHAEEIGYKHYYKKHDVNLLPDAIRGDVFMGIWGTGKPDIVIKWLQDVLGVPKTGKIDDETVRASKSYQGNLRKEFLRKRLTNMRSLEDFEKYGNGWTKSIYFYLKNGCHSISENGQEIKTKKCPQVTRKSYGSNCSSGNIVIK